MPVAVTTSCNAPRSPQQRLGVRVPTRFSRLPPSSPAAALRQPARSQPKFRQSRCAALKRPAPHWRHGFPPPAAAAAAAASPPARSQHHIRLPASTNPNSSHAALYWQLATLACGLALASDWGQMTEGQQQHEAVSAIHQAIAQHAPHLGAVASAAVGALAAAAGAAAALCNRAYAVAKLKSVEYSGLVRTGGSAAACGRRGCLWVLVLWWGHTKQSSDCMLRADRPSSLRWCPPPSLKDPADIEDIFLLLAPDAMYQL